MMQESTVQQLPFETLSAFENDAFRARIFHEKYALRDAAGAILERTPAHMWQRVSRGVARVGVWWWFAGVRAATLGVRGGLFTARATVGCRGPWPAVDGRS